MKKLSFGFAIAIIYICSLVPTGVSATYAAPLLQGESNTESADEPNKNAAPIQKVLSKVAAAEKKNNYAQLQKLMTSSAWDEFVASKVIEATMMASPEMGGNDNILDVLDEFEIDAEPPEMGFDVDFDELQADILKDLGDNKTRIKLLKKLDKAKAAPAGGGMGVMMIEMSMFEGDLVGSNIDGDVATIQLKPSLPDLPAGAIVMNADEMPEGVEMEDFGPDGPPGMPEGAEIMGGMPEFPPITLKFRNVDSSWKFDGVDMEAMEFGGMNHPTIEDPDFSGTTVDGKEIKLEDLRGKLVLVDFWGTWCKGCIAEFPKLKKLAKALEGKDFVIVGIAQDSKKDLEKFLSKKPLPWANVVDSDGELCTRFKVNVFPTTMLIDQKGNHVASNLSPKALVKEIGERLKLEEAEIEELLKAVKPKKKRVRQTEAF